MDKIDVLDHGFVRLVDSMGSDLSITRAARVSYDAAWRAGEDEGSDARLIRYLWKNKHTSPFEAVEFQFEVKAPIFVFRQWHRHRTWCLSGDTEITFELPNRIRQGVRGSKKLRLDDLHRKWSENPPVKRKDKQKRSLRDFRREQISNMLLRVYDEKAGEFTIGHICDVIASGVKEIFEITLANGKKLKCTEDHKILTPDGWLPLKDAIGLVVVGKTAGMTKEAFILTNGVPAYKSEEWLRAKRLDGASVQSIADAANCSYHTIRKWLKTYDLQFSREERDFRKGMKPWNKGVTGYSTSRVVTDAEKEIIRKSRSGENSNFWKGGITSDRANIGRWTTQTAPYVHAKNGWRCTECGSNKKLEAHHIKPVVTHPELAYDIENLTTLCRKCHRKLHGFTGEFMMGKGVTLTAHPQKIVSVRLVGEEMTYDLSVEGDNHNFVANGMIVHNCFNELSARYRELPEEFYVPEPKDIGVQSKDNKQARDLDRENETAKLAAATIREACKDSFREYKILIKEGIPRELARSVLPVATYSHMFAKVDLRNLFHFLDLRLHSHAQFEIRVYAEAILELIRPVVPVAVQAWEENRG
jgi:thymidylate synthase (FAD)